jgi:hypothetical protein
MGWRATSRATLAALLCLGVAAHADNSGEPTATPYRPTISNPADLSVPGWLELELGGLHISGANGADSDTIPWLLKYAFDENSGVLIGGNAFDRATVADGRRISGVGDTFVEWKQRFPIREGMAFGFEAGVQVPSAPSAIGIGKPAYLVNGIYSVDLGGAHLDVNYGGARYTSITSGAKAFGASHWQSTWAAALSRPFTDRFGGAVEISGAAQQGAGHSHQALAAVNYNLSRRVVFDIGVALGLDHAAHDRSVFAGGTFLLGKLH